MQSSFLGSSVKMRRLETKQRLIHLHGMTIQNQMVSQKGIKRKIKIQKRQTEAMSFRLLQTIYSHVNQRL